MNNPLKFTDPSGLYARQKHYEKEGGSEGTYIPFDIPPVYFQAGFSCYSSFDLSNNIETLLSSHYGGYCSDATGIIFYKSPEQALVNGMYYVQVHNGWKDTEYKSMKATVYDYLVENTNIFDLASLGGENLGGKSDGPLIRSPYPYCESKSIFMNLYYWYEYIGNNVDQYFEGDCNDGVAPTPVQVIVGSMMLHTSIITNLCTTATGTNPFTGQDVSPFKQYFVAPIDVILDVSGVPQSIQLYWDIFPSFFDTDK